MQFAKIDDFLTICKYTYLFIKRKLMHSGFCLKHCLLLTKFKLPARTGNKTCLNLYPFQSRLMVPQSTEMFLKKCHSTGKYRMTCWMTEASSVEQQIIRTIMFIMARVHCMLLPGCVTEFSVASGHFHCPWDKLFTI